MDKTKQQLVKINDYHLHDTTVGNSKFKDDVWDLSILIKSKTTKKSHKIIDFSYVHSEELKEVIKIYSYYLLSKLKPQTVRFKNFLIRMFISYCKEHSINSFQEVNNVILMDFEIYLKNQISKHGKPYAPSTCYQCFQAIEELIEVGQIEGWLVPNQNLTKISVQFSKQRRTEEEDRKTQSIPPKVFSEILKFAIHKEKNIITKAGIIIQSQTGLRISEVLGIKKGCISKTSNGDYYMIVRTSKTEKDDSITHKIFVNQLVVDTVKDLEKYTEHLRKESGYEELFLVRYNGVNVLKTSKFQEKRIPNFIKRHDIRDENGQLYKLNSHQFRVNFVNDLIDKKIPLAFIMKHFNHVSIEMTAWYSRLKMEKIAQMMKDILKPNSKIAGINASIIQRNLSEQFKGKTEEEIETFVSELSKNMYVNPLPTGVCLQDTRRGDCDNGDGCIFINCPNYVTTEDYYPIHKRELNLLESEMKRYENDGRVREYQRLKAKWIYLKPIVDSLEEQINEK